MRAILYGLYSMVSEMFFASSPLELIIIQSYVYANGEPNHSPRFSLRVPDWSVEFKCDVIYCESGRVHFNYSLILMNFICLNIN